MKVIEMKPIRSFFKNIQRENSRTRAHLRLFLLYSRETGVRSANWELLSAISAFDSRQPFLAQIIQEEPGPSACALV